MTIAAGFPCKQGVVLCADTQETIQGYVKTDTQKIRLAKLKNYNVAVAGAGETELIETTVDRIFNRLMESPELSSHGEVLSVLSDNARAVFQDCVAPYSSFPRDDRPSATLLVAIQFEDCCSLYRLRETMLYEVEVADCIGMGIALGKSLIAQFANREDSLARTGITALYILYQAKKWIDGCGGNSDVLLLPHKDRTIIRIPTEKVKEMEAHFEQFNQAIQPLLVSIADGSLSHDEYEKVMKQFEWAMLGLRAKFMEFEELWKRLHEFQGLPVPPLPV